MQPDPAKDEDPAPITLMEQFTRGDLFAQQCPSREILKHVTSRWGVLVLLALLNGTQRFSELRRKIGGVSEKMLAQTLQWWRLTVLCCGCPIPWCRPTWSTL